jgi:hypothetical protein
MRKSFIVAVALACAVISPAALPAGSFLFDATQFPSARMSALGGTHAALADDISVLLSNPGGFRSAGPQLSVAELTTNLSGPIFSIADVAFRIAGSASPSSLLLEPEVQKLLTSLYAGATINGPLALAYIGNGLGFGFFNSTSASFSTQGTVPTVTTTMKEDLLFIAGYGFRIPLPDKSLSTLDVGFSVKGFTRAGIQWSESILSFFSLFTSPSSGGLTGQPFTLDLGFGLDVGALYNWNSFISVGLAARNVFSPVVRSAYTSLDAFSSGGTPTMSNGNAPLDLSLGLLLTPRLGFLENYLSNPKIMLDYGDIIDFWTHPDTASNPILHVGLGVEVTLLDVLALRGGFGDGYFSAGAGINLTAFRLDLTMFGRELSTQPGLRPSYNLIMSTTFRY